MARARGACLTTLVSASWTTRYSVSSSAGESCRSVPDVRSSTGVPEARTVSTSSLRSTSFGAGASAAASASSSRSSPSTTRSSSWAVRPIISIDSSAAPASSGRFAIRRRPTPAWTVITASVWATTSCSSRAMRTRSSRTSCRVRSASVARSRSACSASPATERRRAATLSPINHPAASGRKPTAPAASGWSPYVTPAYRTAAPKIAAAARTARIDNRRGTPTATLYPATPSTRVTSSDPVPDAICAAAAALASARTGTGHRLLNAITGMHSRTAGSSLGPCACPS